VATGASDVIGRKEGLAPAGMWLYYWMLCRYGIRELFTFNKMGRLILFILIAFIGLMGGFRGTLVMFVLTFCILFYLEGLFRSKLAPILAFLCVSAAALLMPLASHLPLNIQRTLTVIPLVPVDPIVQVSSQASSEWRLRIWRHVIPQVQDHLVLGKGYAFNAEDLATLSLARADSTEGTELVGDYHNGPLSVILPFGIPGVIAFVWFLVAALRVLYNNVHYGDEDYRTINRFLFAYFVSKVIFFFTVFGGMNSDLANFVGILGLSVSLNGGMAKPVVPERPTIVFNRFKLHPSVRPV
jgi:hypothetical protein